MRPGKTALAALLCLFFFHPLNAEAGEARREAVHQRAQSAAMRAEEPAWQKEIRRRLEKQVSFDFLKTPFGEAIQQIQHAANVNVVLDPQALEDIGGDVPVTLNVQNMPLGTVLRWVTRLVGMNYALRDRAVFVSVPSTVWGDPVLKVYDVHDIVRPGWSYSVPRVDLSGRVLAPRVVHSRGALDEETLMYMLQERVRPETWSPDLGTSVEAVEGKLVVIQTEDVHRMVASLLAALRLRDTLHVGTEVRLLSLSETLVEDIRAREKPAAGVVFLKQDQMDLITGALAAGKQAELVGTATVICENGRPAHTVLGNTFQRPGDEISGTFFRGILLVVWPRVAQDRRYVNLDIRLTCLLGEPTQVFQAVSTITCLETDTVMLTGAAAPPANASRRLVALVTPRILHLEPPQEAARRALEQPRPRKAPDPPQRPLW